LTARKPTINGTVAGDKLIAKRFAALRQHPCWGLHYDRQLNLTMSFGRPSLRIREPFVTQSKSLAAQGISSRRLVTVRGQWWLWLFCCYWQLQQKGEVLATGSASFRRIELALKELDGQKLTSLSVDRSTGRSHFVFDLGCELVCRRFEPDSNSDVWTLYGPKDVVSVTGQGAVRCERESETERRRGQSGPSLVNT
jgi:hypothetical protein